MQFDTMANGVRCTAKILTNYRTKGLVTVREMVNRWAPPVENHTAAYAEHVAERMGLEPDVPFPLTPDNLSAMCQAIFVHENGGDYVSPADLRSGVLAALNG
jgi:hypothetical protein